MDQIYQKSFYIENILVLLDFLTKKIIQDSL